MTAFTRKVGPGINILNRAEESPDVIERGEAERRAGARIWWRELFQLFREGFELLLHQLITGALCCFGERCVERVKSFCRSAPGWRGVRTISLRVRIVP